MLYAGRDEHERQRVRGLHTQAGVAHGHLREGMGETIANSGVRHARRAVRCALHAHYVLSLLKPYVRVCRS